MSGVGPVPVPPVSATVIIPAHDEERTIGGGLRALLGDAAPGELDVVVVCNGCTDRTAEVAREAAAELGHPVRVLAIPEASKPAAIRAAEAVATGFPRVYLDADVRCPTATVRALVGAVRDGAPLAVPTRVLELSRSSATARAYYEGWQALPWVQEQLAGRGAYAISARTRATFGEFPDGIADDRYVTTRVPRAEAVIVPEPVLIRPPAQVGDVLRARTRIYAGNAQGEAPAHDAGGGLRLAGMARTAARDVRLAPAIAVFAGVSTVAKVRAARAARSGRVGWGRAPRARSELAGAVPAATDGAGRDLRSVPDDAAAVDVVVVTYRSAGYVADCLRSALAALHDVPGARLLVVDNDSGDDIADVVAAVPDPDGRIHLELRDVNDGFASGCHAGARLSTARRLLFLNPDATVDPDAVRALLDCALAHPRAGMIGGRAVDADGRTDPRSWWGRPTLWSALCFATGLSSLLPGSRLFDPESADGWDGRAREVGVVSGGLMLVDRDLWDALGGFDPGFFLYGEDADLSLRAWAAGWRPRVCPEAVWRHRVGASSEGSNRLPLVLQGKVTTYRRNLPAPRGVLAGELLVVGTGLRALAAGLRGARALRFLPGLGRPVRPGSGAAAWRDAWRRRAQWRRGWPDALEPGTRQEDTA